ncbi:FadR/GntR family transcriptional regulator [Dongia sedimenti]|uniref:FCD domain-containing protein n=1 Tax=Dongia sedimenti TaxID=3064282 RepID=A0ABU0YIS5_9PROT|nr:FCD domain-containing protein [Rhodospirillaceae bacterium R-7]
MERTDHTLTKLRQLIASPDFSGGGRMPPERSLASELGVGRRSLRRALEVLEREGRISRHQGRGTFINGANGLPGDVGKESGPALVRAVGAAVRAGTDLRANPAFANILDHTNPLEVIEVRLAIEPVMARLAAFRASQTEIDKLLAIAGETRAAPDSAHYEEADVRFHRTIAEVARNALFLAVFDTLYASQRDPAWRRLGENAHCFKRQSVYADFHQDISAAIAARQGEKAENLMQRHLSDVQRYIYEHAFPAATLQQ